MENKRTPTLASDLMKLGGKKKPEEGRGGEVSKNRFVWAWRTEGRKGGRGTSQK